ncbi:MAG: hypothetical protein QGG40_10940, partial [Myxococcota bacterium]|nr:hypothetical protein [Myxococcota bacterium]
VKPLSDAAAQALLRARCGPDAPGAEVLADLVEARRRPHSESVCAQPRLLSRDRPSAAAWLDSREPGS